MNLNRIGETRRRRINYREPNWPDGTYAPYQVLLEDEGALIYVPKDTDIYCRDSLPRADDDALAEGNKHNRTVMPGTISPNEGLSCPNDDNAKDEPLHIVDTSGCYRSGKCGVVNRCPRHWSAVELYSQHYRAVQRKGLKVTRIKSNLGTVRVGSTITLKAATTHPSHAGFLQAPMLVRLPPGVRFEDDGSLHGKVLFDPYQQHSEYEVNFVAVSTAQWKDKDIGVVRLEITFLVQGNDIPPTFDRNDFLSKQEAAHKQANAHLAKLERIWQDCQENRLDYQETCDEMCCQLDELRTLLEQHPRLENGLYWAHLGGFHMNVHKLLENALFECELYLGYALTFDNPQVRQYAEANLEGCYQKRLLEAARFMWMDGVKLIMDSQWVEAMEILVSAAKMKDGWGWAVNHGDIWLADAAARLLQGSHAVIQNKGTAEIIKDEITWITEAEHLVAKAAARSRESFPSGHPWANEIGSAIASFRRGMSSSSNDAYFIVEWHEQFKTRTNYWCAMVLAGSSIFPPKVKARRADAVALVERLPGHNAAVAY